MCFGVYKNVQALVLCINFCCSDEFQVSPYVLKYSLTYATFRDKFVGICQQIFEYGLQEHAKREEEIQSFWECVEEAKTENKEIGMVAIENFMNSKKKVSK